MKLSPTDIQRQTFGQRFRGLDRDEVRSFLATVAEEMAALQRERDTTEQQLRHLELIVNEHRERESILKNTLLSAQWQPLQIDHHVDPGTVAPGATEPAAPADSDDAIQSFEAARARFLKWIGTSPRRKPWTQAW